MNDKTITKCVFSNVSVAVTLHDKSKPPQSIPEVGQDVLQTQPDETRPFQAPVVRCDRVTSADHFQDTRLVEFDISGSGVPAYSPGDVCYVRPANLAENVDFFFDLFPGLRQEAVLSLERNSDIDLPPATVLPPHFTLRQCVERLWDIQAIPGECFTRHLLFAKLQI